MRSTYAEITRLPTIFAPSLAILINFLTAITSAGMTLSMKNRFLEVLAISLIASQLGPSSALAAASNEEARTVRLKKVSREEHQRLRRLLLAPQDWGSAALKMGNDGTSECELFRSRLPKTMVQGFVEVEEDSQNPTGPKIKVFYYGNLVEGKEPVVFYNGGPGSDSHGSFDLLSRVKDYSDFSFVFIDQRGTGCSSSYPSEFSEQTLLRLTHYGSRGIVNDSEAVREALLGEKSKWKVFGQSYGGKIVHKYLALKPESLKAAYSHGFSVMTDGDEWMLMRIDSQRRVLSEYLKTYPKDGNKISRLRSLIPENLCFTDDELKVCGPKVLDGLVMYLGFKYTWPYLHSAIEGMLSSEGNLNRPALDRFVRQVVFGIYGHNYVAGSVIGMSDMSTGKPTFDFCAEPMRRLEERGQAPLTWILNECRLLAGMSNEKWDPILKKMTERVEILDELKLTDIRSALLSFRDLAFFLYAGALDVFVPQETFQEEVQFLDGLMTYRLFQESGHEGFYTEMDIWQDLRR